VSAISKIFQSCHHSHSNISGLVLNILRLFHLVISFTVVVLTCFVMCGFCNVWMCVCVGILVICVLVFTVFCIVCTVFFVLFRLCIFILICFVCTIVRTTATE